MPPIRWPCWPTPATISATCSGWSWPTSAPGWSAARPSARFTYGLKKSSILAALVNALLLLVAVGAIGAEAIRRLVEPEASDGRTVMAVAAVGILVNSATAMLFARGRKGDLNVRGAYLHMVADAAVSAGVVIAGALILWTGERWIDPAASLAVAAIILWGTWGLLAEATAMTLAGTPRGIDPAEVGAALEALPGVAGTHHLHIWPLSTTETAMTVHLIGRRPGRPRPIILASAEASTTASASTIRPFRSSARRRRRRLRRLLMPKSSNVTHLECSADR